MNKYGCRVVGMAGSLIGAIAFVLSTFSPNIEVLIFTYGILGGELAWVISEWYHRCNDWWLSVCLS